MRDYVRRLLDAPRPGEEETVISPAGALTDLFTIIIILAIAAIIGVALANIHFAWTTSLAIFVLEVALILLAVNKAIPVLISVIKQSGRLVNSCHEAWDDVRGYRERQQVNVKIRATNVVNEVTVDVSMYKEQVLEDQEFFKQVLMGIQHQLAAAEQDHQTADVAGEPDAALHAAPGAEPAHD
jgi:hypothetical protein